MKKGYIWSRLLRSLLSVLIIMLIVFTMVYTMIPRDNIFFEDSTYRKLGGKADDKTEYIYTTWKRLGYLDYVRINDYCLNLYEAGSPEMIAAIEPDSPESQAFVEQYSAQGYTIANFTKSGRYYAYKDTPVIKRMANWLAHLIVIDTPWSVKDETNPDLERSLRFGTTPTGGVALIGSGTTHKYLLYTDSRFPWIHQNIITLNFGTSYPTYQGLDVLRVLFQSQGTEVKRPVTFETGYEAESGIIFGSLKYKSVLDRMDMKKFTDHYAAYETQKGQPSMIGTSFIMGILAMALAYILGLPFGVLMARNKDKFADKLGMVYIIFIIAVPSLAYIYLFRYLGTNALQSAVGLYDLWPRRRAILDFAHHLAGAALHREPHALDAPLCCGSDERRLCEVRQGQGPQPARDFQPSYLQKCYHPHRAGHPRVSCGLHHRRDHHRVHLFRRRHGQNAAQRHQSVQQHHDRCACIHVLLGLGAVRAGGRHCSHQGRSAHFAQ